MVTKEGKLYTWFEGEEELEAVGHHATFTQVVSGEGFYLALGADVFEESSRLIDSSGREAFKEKRDATNLSERDEKIRELEIVVEGMKNENYRLSEELREVVRRRRTTEKAEIGRLTAEIVKKE